MLLVHSFHAGFFPNYSTCSWLIDVYCSQNNVECLLSLPDEIANRGFHVYKSLYRALIRRLCKRGLVDFAQMTFNKMLGKGFVGDNLIYCTLAYGHLSAGKRIAACELLDEMVKKQLMITAKVYKCLSVSYAKESCILDLLWSHAIERALIARNVYKLMQEARPNYQSGNTMNMPC